MNPASSSMNSFFARSWALGTVLALLVFGLLEFALPRLYADSLSENALAILKDLAPAVALLCFAPVIMGMMRRREALRRTPMMRRLDALRDLTSQDFEGRVAMAFRRQGYSVEELGSLVGAAAVDLVLRRRGERTLVQCKAWRERRGKLHLIRSSHATMINEGAAACKVLCCGTFEAAAIRFAQDKPIELIDGVRLLELLGVDDGFTAPQALVNAITSFRPDVVAAANDGSSETAEGTSGTPSNFEENANGFAEPDPALPTPECPRCGSPMKLRQAGKGGAAGVSFWSCTRAPECGGKRPA